MTPQDVQRSPVPLVEIRTTCAAAIAADHAYETPEIIVAPITASAAYATWVGESVAEDDGAGRG
jgi:hypothetical protein